MLNLASKFIADIPLLKTTLICMKPKSDAVPILKIYQSGKLRLHLSFAIFNANFEVHKLKFNILSRVSNSKLTCRLVSCKGFYILEVATAATTRKRATPVHRDMLIASYLASLPIKSRAKHSTGTRKNILANAMNPTEITKTPLKYFCCYIAKS